MYKHISRQILLSKKFWLGVIMCLLVISYTNNNAYAWECTPTDEVIKGYSDSCFPCQIVKTLISSFLKAADNVYDVSKTAGKKLLLIGAMLWLAIWALTSLSSLQKMEPLNMIDDLIKFLGKCLVAYCFIVAGTSALIGYTINPILSTGADMGISLMLESNSFKPDAPLEAENKYDGPTEIVSEKVLNKILKLSESISNEVSVNMAMGQSMMCFSVDRILFRILNFAIPDFWILICGGALWCIGFMLTLSVCYYLIDIPFKLGFAIIALPVVIGLWPFGMTKSYLGSCLKIILNAAGTFLFLALSSSYAMRLIDASFRVQQGPTKCPDARDKEAVFCALNAGDISYISKTFSIFGPSFFVIVFAYLYGIHLISNLTNKYPDKFFSSGMTGAQNSPIHDMSTGATMWAGSKVAKPLKLATDIVSHQAGRFATAVVSTGVESATNGVRKGANWMKGLVKKYKNPKANENAPKKQPVPYAPTNGGLFNDHANQTNANQANADSMYQAQLESLEKSLKVTENEINSVQEHMAANRDDYIRYKTDRRLNDQHDTSLSDYRDNAENRLFEAQEKLNTAVNEHNRLENLKNEINPLENDLTMAKSELEDKKQYLDDKTNLLDEKQRNFDDISREYEDRNRNFEDKQRDYEEKSRLYEDKQRELDDAIERQNNDDRSITDSDIDNLREEAENLRDEMNDAKDEVENAREDFQAGREDYENVRAELNDVRDEVEDTREDVNNTSQHVKDVESELNEKRNEIGSNENIDQAIAHSQADIAKYQTEFDNARQDLRHYPNESGSLLHHDDYLVDRMLINRREITNDKRKLEALKNERNRIKEAIRETKARMHNQN